MVPALIHSVKVAGLVLVTNTSGDSASDNTESHCYSSFRMPDGVDGVLKGNGVLRFNETIDM
jgi:CDK inhibitor PHO81